MKMLPLLYWIFLDSAMPSTGLHTELQHKTQTSELGTFSVLGLVMGGHHMDYNEGEF